MKRFMLVALLCLFCSYLNGSTLVVVVNKNNDTGVLSKREVIDIFMGRFDTFPDGKKAQPLDMPSKSGLKNQFYIQLINQKEQKINAYWARLQFSGRAKPPKQTQSIKDAMRQLYDSNEIITYVPESQVTEALKVVFKFDNH